MWTKGDKGMMLNVIILYLFKKYDITEHLGNRRKHMA